MRKARQIRTRAKPGKKPKTALTQDSEGANKARSTRGRPRGTGSETVYQNVRTQILSLKLRPGSDIDELDLVRQFGVSRTPVREALIRLSSEGLVSLMPNVGARVASLNADEVPQILEALELTQRVTARWAALRRRPPELEEIRAACQAFEAAIETLDFNRMGEANRAFHASIGRASRNAFLGIFHDSVAGASLRLGRLAFAEAQATDAEYRAYYAIVNRHHWQLVKAIEEQDAETADEVAREHISLFRERIGRFLRTNLASDTPLSAPSG